MNGLQQTAWVYRAFAVIGALIDVGRVFAATTHSTVWHWIGAVGFSGWAVDRFSTL